MIKELNTARFELDAQLRDLQRVYSDELRAHKILNVKQRELQDSIEAYNKKLVNHSIIGYSSSRK